MWETWVQSLGWEDPLEKGKAIHCSILDGEFHAEVLGVAKSRTQQQLSLSLCSFHQPQFRAHTRTVKRPPTMEHLKQNNRTGNKTEINLFDTP